MEEPGCLRFDLFQSDADENHLIIEEMYQTPEDAAKHKETAHYLAWREAVADSMEKPREGVGVTPLFTQRPQLRAPCAPPTHAPHTPPRPPPSACAHAPDENVQMRAGARRPGP